MKVKTEKRKKVWNKIKTIELYCGPGFIFLRLGSEFTHLFVRIHPAAKLPEPGVEVAHVERKCRALQRDQLFAPVLQVCRLSGAY